jgi:hypothetical protein
VALNYRASLKTTRMNAVVTDLDNNAAAATLEIGTAAFAAVLCSIVLGDPSFTVAADVMTMAGTPRSATAGATGTAAAARYKDGGGTIIISGMTVGTSGSDVNLNSVAIVSGQTITITSATHTHAP